MAHQVKTTFFGTPHIETADGTIRLRRRKSLAVLAYLAVTNQPVHRERLITLLWPEATTNVGQSSLRNILADLNATPLGDCLILVDDTVDLSRDLEIDVRQFMNYIAKIREARCRIEHLSAQCVIWMNEIYTLYVGEFMEHFSIKGSPEFDDWLLVQRMKYQHLVEDILDVLARYYLHIGETATALFLTEHWLDINPYDERAHRMIMHQNAQNDQIVRAIEQYHLLVRLLNNNYARTPEEDTTALYEAIRNGTYMERRPPLSAGKSVRSFLPSAPRMLIGREHELEWLKARLAGNYRALAIVGELGVGKTALAAYLAYDDRIRELFPDGVLWTSLGPTPDLASILRLWMDALRISELQSSTSIEHLLLQLTAGLYDKRLLLIVDNVWSVQAARAFYSAQTESVTIFTSRWPNIARQVIMSPDAMLHLQPLDNHDAIEVITKLAPTLIEQHPPAVRRLVKNYAGLPLALHMLAQIYHQKRSASVDIILQHMTMPENLLNASVILDQISTDVRPPYLSEVIEEYLAFLPASVQDHLVAIVLSQADKHIFDVQALSEIWSSTLVDEMLDYGLLIFTDDHFLRVNPLLAAYLRTHGQRF